MHSNQNDIKIKLKNSLKVIQMYKWMLDAYVLDFFVENHWEKMPKSWIQSLANIPPEHLTDLLNEPENNTEKHIWPLSLLALRTVTQKLSISRTALPFSNEINMTTNRSNQNDPNNNPKENFSCLTHPKIKTILTKKKIKEKKRHEIERMSQLTAGIANDLGVKYIVDFGSGLGHLARLLAYGYGLNVCCLEKEETLTKQANELDNQMNELTTRFCPDGTTFQRPVHLNMCLSRQTSFKDLVQGIKRCFRIDENDKNFRFGIIGLHPCGDLASILTNFFLQCPEAKFLNLVGCCYFKITTACDRLNKNEIGYPLSKYLSGANIPAHLSFEAREIACHANEVYGMRLSDKNYENLRVHSFRAAIEKIICKYWPEKKHSGLRNIKRLTTFKEYCELAVNHLNDVKIPEHEIHAPDTLHNLNNWKLIVIFYTLRLMLAPVVESVILYDRIQCMLEHGCSTKIDAIFDPIISARNHIITSIKS